MFDLATVTAAPTTGLTLAVAKDTDDTANNDKAMTPGA